MKQYYYVGELAEFFGVSKDTLRLYDKLGILSPKKDQSNHYRVYDRADFICLDYVIRLKKMKFSLEEINTLINDSTIQRAEAMLQIRERALQEEIIQLQKTLSIVDDYKKMMRSCINTMDEIFIMQSPRMLCKIAEDSMIDVLNEFNKLTDRHVPRFTLFTDRNEFMSDNLKKQVTDPAYRQRISTNAITLIDDENHSECEEFLKTDFLVIEPRKCVYTTGKCYTHVDYELYIRVHDYLKEKHLKLTDDILFRIISTRNNKEKSVDYYEAWAPIE